MKRTSNSILINKHWLYVNDIVVRVNTKDEKPTFTEAFRILIPGDYNSVVSKSLYPVGIFKRALEISAKCGSNILKEIDNESEEKAVS